MTFQFQCPQCANLLQAEESHTGQQCHCPMCQTLFIIPSPVVQPATATPQAPTTSATPQPTEPTTSQPSSTPFPNVTGPAQPPPSEPPAPTAPQEPEVLHIPCPECREVLETLVEMLDQDVMCPHCQAQFQLRRQDSMEERQKRKRQREKREQQLNNTWLYWSIAVVVLVLGFLLFLIMSSGS